jgi:arsenate reductase (thioredoxin)
MKTIIKDKIQGLTQNFDSIPEERIAILDSFAEVIKKYLKRNSRADLIFICTHNSRRSHLAQIWAELAADYYGIVGIRTYSGGTEATAFYPSAVGVVKEFGLDISIKKEGKNPVYLINYYDDNIQKAFSKVYNDKANPQENFIAIMVCSHADANCPTVFGASTRVSLPYDDPKEYDGTDQENEKYMERFLEIGTEILYTFSKIS